LKHGRRQGEHGELAIHIQTCIGVCIGVNCYCVDEWYVLAGGTLCHQRSPRLAPGHLPFHEGGGFAASDFGPLTHMYPNKGRLLRTRKWEEMGRKGAAGGQDMLAAKSKGPWRGGVQVAVS
jgi:hypothetical protein